MMKILRGLIGAAGGLLGYSIVNFVRDLKVVNIDFLSWMGISIYVGTTLLFAIIFLYFSGGIINRLKKLIKYMETELQKFSIYDILISSIGLIMGLVIAYLISILVYKINIFYINLVVPVALYIILGYLGLTFPHKKKNDIYNLFVSVSNIKKTPMIEEKPAQLKAELCPKIMDTSVIIDGRILDICRTQFIEGPIVIPEFVLEELQKIADSSDSLKRTRGRRGLDIINEMQKELDMEIIITDRDYEDIKEVDSKLLKLTKELNGRVLTNDYNLNKVAEVQGIVVLNINDLANAIKPIVLPGEEMHIHVVKDGKEANQGLAYLDDGTMIVVEKGRQYMGQNIFVIVTSVLQTSAGRMIFARPK